LYNAVYLAKLQRLIHSNRQIIYRCREFLVLFFNDSTIRKPQQFVSSTKAVTPLLMNIN